MVHRVLALCLLLPLCVLGCKLERQHEFLRHQYQVHNLDNAIAEQQNLEEEYLRERAHVNRLNAEVSRLISREEALAMERQDALSRVETSQQELARVSQQLAGVQKKVKDEKALVVAGQKELEQARTPAQREALSQRIAQLRAESARLEKVLAELPPPTPEKPAEAKPVDKAAVPPAAGGKPAPDPEKVEKKEPAKKDGAGGA